jgi:pimeloyl-ACP methyl ester carboxylesterase
VRLVLLPGLDGTGLLFQPLLAELPVQIRTTVVAYPGDHELGLVELADMVARRLPAERSVVLAESFSGLVLLALLANRPPRVAGAIFVGTFAEPPRPLLLRLAPLVVGSGAMVRSAPSFLLRRYCLGADASAAQIRMLREALATVSPKILAQRLDLIAKRQVFPAVAVPSAYLRATEDRLVPARCADAFRNVVEVKGPHFLLQTRPRECAQLIVQMIKSFDER